MPSHFHLTVFPAQKLDLTFLHVSPEVSSQVRPRSRLFTVLVRDELLRRHLRPLQITSRYSFSSYPQLSSHSHRRQLTVPLTDSYPRILQRPSYDVLTSHFFRSRAMTDADDRPFRRAV